jgi:predicted nucleic acid-binding protein
MIYKIMTSIACNAIKRKYPITPNQIAELIRQLDRDTANIYAKRPLQTEAERALEYAYRTVE